MLTRQKTIGTRKWMLLPLEIKARELDAKVLLACAVAESGYGVILGKNGFNLAGDFPQGIYFDKSLSSNKEGVLERQVDELKNKLVSLDEEGLVNINDRVMTEIRSSNKTIDLSTYIFTWGREQYSILNNKYDIDNKLILTGSPRTDIWMKSMHFLYKDKATQIKTEIGKFILIPSNFAMSNNANSPDFIVKQSLDYGHISGEEEVHELKNQISYTDNIFNKFLEMIPLIAQSNPGLTIVLRPHPGDNISVWNKKALSWPENVRVIYEGSISPWILASEFIIHNSCTSAVEAYAMEKPAIAYMPFFDDRYEQNIPNPLSQQANTVNDVLNLIQANLNNEGLGRSSVKSNLFKKHLHYDAHQLAVDRIVKALDTIELTESEYMLPSTYRKYNIKKIFNYTKGLLAEIFGRTEMNRSYRKQKNPGIKTDEICEIVQLYRDNLNRFKDVNVESIGNNSFIFYID
jgi:surface carbohydrate biosynthesis protein